VVLDTDIPPHATGNCLVVVKKWDRLSVCKRAVCNPRDFDMVRFYLKLKD